MNSIRPARAEEFDKVYSILEESFPPDERRSREAQKALLQDDRYTIYLLPEGRAVKAFITVWQFDDFAVVEHFAVNPDYRNQGLGSLILKQLREVLPCRIVLEVELPDTEFARRRIGFYQRNGYVFNAYPYIQPPYSKEKQPVPLRIMSEGSPLSREEFDTITAMMQSEIYKA